MPTSISTRRNLTTCQKLFCVICAVGCLTLICISVISTSPKDVTDLYELTVLNETKLIITSTQATPKDIIDLYEFVPTLNGTELISSQSITSTEAIGPSAPSTIWRDNMTDIGM